MNIDGRIAARILNFFTRRDIPVLCVHDSFLINYRMAGRLKAAMSAVTLLMFGQPIALSNNYLGLDEIEKRSPELVDDYIGMRHRERCPEYLIRQRLFGERVSYFGSLGLEG